MHHRERLLTVRKCSGEEISAYKNALSSPDDLDSFLNAARSADRVAFFIQHPALDAEMMEDGMVISQPSSFVVITSI